MFYRKITGLNQGLKNISAYTYNASLASVLIGLLFSRAMISIGIATFIINWIVEGNYREKWHTLQHNKQFAAISLIFFIYLIGSFYSQIPEEALNDLKIKLPLLLPVFYFSVPKFSSKIHIKPLIITYLLAVIIKTVILYIQFNLQVEYVTIEDQYKINFYSNIRLSLFINLAIFLLFYYTFVKKVCKKQFRIAAFSAIIWLVFFLYFLASLTGYLVFAAISIWAIYIYLYHNFSSKYYLYFFYIIGVIFFISGFYIAINFYNFQNKDVVNFTNLPPTTINGNVYTHNICSDFAECGHFVNLYICRDEMRREWNKKSKLDFDGKDLKGQSLEATITRYLSSKNLTKDSLGINQLSLHDIRYIENGCANYLYTKKYSLKAKLYLIWWQLNMYNKTGNAGNQSISQRIEYFKVSYQIIKNNFWFGVGTGALLQKTLQVFEELNSKTDKKYWFVVHNQFVYMFASFGFLGFALFILLFFYPISRQKILANPLFTAFYIIIFISFLTDNTLEMQLGISFFVVFFLLLSR